MTSVATKLERLLGADRAVVTPEAMEIYGTDESGLGPYPPEAVALVENAAEAREVLRLAALDRIAVTPRGLGTGKAGGALPVHRGIVLSTERMRRVTAIDPDNLLAIAEPGVITGALQRQVEQAGLFYPPDPASLDSCSIGGNVAANAGGPRAFKYGVTRDHVLGLSLTLLGGEELQLGRQTSKGVTGLDLVALTVGSEGILGLISEVTLKLVPKPQAVGTFLARFRDVLRAGAAVTAMIADGHRPRAIELLDAHVVEHLRLDGGWPLPRERCALLLVELDGHAEGLERRLVTAADACERAGADEILVATDERRRRQLWDMRRAVSRVLKARYRAKVSEDVVVPRAAIPEMLRRLDALSVAHGVAIAAYGHAGDGNLHVNVLLDDAEGGPGSLSHSGPDRVASVVEEVFRHTLELGGTLSGEHGIGIAKRRFVRWEQADPVVRLQRQLKQAFDPLGLMNPGKMLPDGLSDRVVARNAAA